MLDKRTKAYSSVYRSNVMLLLYLISLDPSAWMIPECISPKHAPVHKSKWVLVKGGGREKIK